MTTTPTAPVRLGSGLTDSFDDNSNEWFVGDYRDQFVIGSRSITNGKYRWEAKAYQPSRFSSVLYLRIAGPGRVDYFNRLDQDLGYPPR